MSSSSKSLGVSSPSGFLGSPSLARHVSADSMARARELVEVLVENGVRSWFYAPGSRDAPLGYVLEEMAEAQRVDLVVRIDERDAAFMALGAARAGKIPAVVMTSGTAVGNVLPAVMEAYHAGLPLVIVSADRPAGLRGTGANQTTWQPGIFANFVGFESDLQPEDPATVIPAAALRAVRVALALEGSSSLAPASPSTLTPVHDAPGPVHLNVSFAEPLVPARVLEAFEALAETKRPGQEASSLENSPALSSLALPIESPLRNCGSVVVVGDHQETLPIPPEATGNIDNPRYLGESKNPGEQIAPRQSGWLPGEAALWQFALEKHLPVLAEPTSGVWRYHPNAVRAASRIVGETDLGKAVNRAFVIGRPTLTRPISRLLKRVPAVELGAKSSVDISEILATLSENSPFWLESWRESGESFAAMLTQKWGIHQVAHEIWGSPQDCDLFLGASLTIRAFDLVASGTTPYSGSPRGTESFPTPTSRRVFTNRGLAGIDGTIASAWGVALASGRAVRAVMGDITFFHDLGSLSYGALEATPNLQVIVLDNGGGEIFERLEHGQATSAVRQRIFLTPQRPDPAALAAAAGWETRTVSDLAKLREVLAKPVDGVSLVRVVLS